MENETNQDGTAEVLVLCTANICRSVMTAALLRRHMAMLGVSVAVRSAGFIRAGDPPSPKVVAVMARYAVDVTSHRSRVVRETDLAATCLAIGLAKEHVRLAVTMCPQVWPRCFTLKELARRAAKTGPRQAGEPLAGWLARLHQGRAKSAMLGDGPDDDIADPLGGPVSGYAKTAAILDELTHQLGLLCWECETSGTFQPRS